MHRKGEALVGVGDNLDRPGVGAGQLIAIPPSDAFLAGLCFFFGALMKNYPTASVECPSDEQSARSRSLGRALPVSPDHRLPRQRQDNPVNRLVQRPELADSAVIINEFGEIALDHLLVAPVEGETIVLASGCLCCAVRGDLPRYVASAVGAGRPRLSPGIQRPLIETSGLADLAPVAQLFLRSLTCFGRRKRSIKAEECRSDKSNTITNQFPKSGG
jgi:hypothetical protein